MLTQSLPDSPHADHQKYAAIYCRVSTQEQADRGYSLPTQLVECHALAAREAYIVPDTYVFSEDYTGTSLNRPKLQVLRELVRQRVVQALIVYDLDRLSRKLAHQLLLCDELEQHGVTLRVVTMPQGERTPETQLLTNVRGIIAEYEREKIIERTGRGKLARLRAGNVPGGRRPLGYTYVRHATSGAHYEVNDDEAALVRRIFRLYAEGGRALETIAGMLMAEGVPTPGDRLTGCPQTLGQGVWHRSTVAGILRNTAYIGTLYAGRKQSLPGKSNPDKKTRWRNMPEETWIPIPTPPIIDDETFYRVQDMLKRNKIESKRNRKADYLFINGRLRCGQCGRAMTGVSNPAGYRDYRCTRPPFQDTVAPHTRRGVSALQVEPVVWEAVERILRNPAVIAAELARQRQAVGTQHSELTQERHAYTRQLADLDKALAKWEAAYIAEVIDLDDFKAKKAEIARRRHALAQELSRLDEQEQALRQVEMETASLETYCRQVRDTLKSFDMAEKRQTLAALQVVVTWHPTQALVITGAIPVEVVSNSSTVTRHNITFSLSA